MKKLNIEEFTRLTEAEKDEYINKLCEEYNAYTHKRYNHKNTREVK